MFISFSLVKSEKTSSPHLSSFLLAVTFLLTSSPSRSLITSHFMLAFSSSPPVSVQACELHVAGYRFSVLSSAFVVHRGFKIQGEFHARKDEENKRNRVLFRNFKEGLKTKYPSSARRC